MQGPALPVIAPRGRSDDRGHGRSTHGLAEGILFWSEWPVGPFPGRQHQLMAALAERVPVIVTEFQHSRRGMPRVSLRACTTTKRRIAAIDFGILERRGVRKMRKFMTPLIAPSLHRQLRSGGVERYVLFTTGTAISRRGLERDRVVIDLMDPPFNGGRAQFESQLAEKLRGASLVVATAETLADGARALGMQPVMIPNGCREVASAAPLAREGAPRVGYLGTIDWRFDVDLIAAVARVMPDVRFVLGGRVLESLRKAVDGQLGMLDNVELLGSVAVECTAELISSFDVGIVPFLGGFDGDSINPVKMYEYLAQGLPIVATPIRECVDNPFVRCPASAEDWIAAIREELAADGPERRMSRLEFARANTWEAHADRLIDELVKRGLLAGEVVTPRAPSGNDVAAPRLIDP